MNTEHKDRMHDNRLVLNLRKYKIISTGVQNSFGTLLMKWTTLSNRRWHFELNRTDKFTNRGRFIRMLAKVNSNSKMNLKTPKGQKIILISSRTELKIILDQTQLSRANHIDKIFIQTHLPKMLIKVKLDQTFKFKWLF